MGILDQVEVIPNVTILFVHLYIAFIKETDNQIIHQWQITLDDLKSEGVVEKILAKYSG